jgi:phosphopantetheine adenylyltransferase/dephospho-CoA kinase
MDILGTQFKAAQPRPHLPKWPYIIGLIGGIASGKSKMSERLGAMGAAIIDCDKLAHTIYEPGEECYYAIISEFGRDVVDNEGKIDRKRLGTIVFANQGKLQQLNQIVWPNLLKKAKERINELHAEHKFKVVILEAAILIQAGWEKECHEVWSMIIPPEVAVQRVMERNNLTELEAKARLGSQVENSVVVSHSNVVFSSLWSYEYSQSQAERAWSELLKRLNISSAKI